MKLSDLQRVAMRTAGVGMDELVVRRKFGWLRHVLILCAYMKGLDSERAVRVMGYRIDNFSKVVEDAKRKFAHDSDFKARYGDFESEVDKLINRRKKEREIALSKPWRSKLFGTFTEEDAKLYRKMIQQAEDYFANDTGGTTNNYRG